MESGGKSERRERKTCEYEVRRGSRRCIDAERGKTQALIQVVRGKSIYLPDSSDRRFPSKKKKEKKHPSLASPSACQSMEAGKAFEEKLMFSRVCLSVLKSSKRRKMTVVDLSRSQ